MYTKSFCIAGAIANKIRQVIAFADPYESEKHRRCKMSCYKHTIYEIIPAASYKIIKNCPGCGHKTIYVNTDRFRVNANGSQIDVWLIYQCGYCGNTYNLSIYKRMRQGCLNQEEYGRFLSNDKDLALEYGTSKELFAENKAEIARNQIDYDIKLIGEEPAEGNDIITIYNPGAIRVRVEKALSGILDMTGSRIKRLMRDEVINCTCKNIGTKTEIVIKTHMVRTEA